MGIVVLVSSLSLTWNRRCVPKKIPSFVPKNVAIGFRKSESFVLHTTKIKTCVEMRYTDAQSIDKKFFTKPPHFRGLQCHLALEKKREMIKKRNSRTIHIYIHIYTTHTPHIHTHSHTHTHTTHHLIY